MKEAEIKLHNPCRIYIQSTNTALRLDYHENTLVMEKEWEDRKSRWRQETALPDAAATWAMNGLKNSDLITDNQNLGNIEDIDKLEGFKKSIRKKLQEHESKLDNLLLGTANSYKLQVSVPMSLNYLMKAWAAAEGRDLSSVALQCMELGLRETRRRGAIPVAAINLYEQVCEKRIALAEMNDQLEKFEKQRKYKGA
tara:strand:- start:887 stop:1477 length:591 start_codon:yes stop_codon:yes gene_type:complete